MLGAAWLSLAVNWLAALVAVATCVLYLGLYTPLKTRTTLSTAVGAIPGALPPLIGWAAAHGSLSLGGWVLFAILFFWQFPHFMAIAWMYREDYARAGIQMLPVVDQKGDATFRQIITHVGDSGVGERAAVGAGHGGNRLFFRCAGAGNDFAAGGTVGQPVANQRSRAKWLMHATVAHIPILLAWLVLDRLITAMSIGISSRDRFRRSTRRSMAPHRSAASRIFFHSHAARYGITASA